jgi:capsular polysaccharide biosynthesis protein
MTDTVLDTRPEDSRTTARPLFPTLIVVLTVLASIAVGFGTYTIYGRANPTYSSAAAIALDQPSLLAKSASTGVIDKLAALRVVYSGLAKTDAVMQPVADELGLSRGAVAAATFTRVPPASLMFFVGAQGSNQAQTQRIAVAFVDRLQQFVVQQQVTNNIPPDLRVTATVVIAPRTSVQVSPTERKRVTIGIVAGLVALILIAGIATPISRRFR